MGLKYRCLMNTVLTILLKRGSPADCLCNYYSRLIHTRYFSTNDIFLLQTLMGHLNISCGTSIVFVSVGNLKFVIYLLIIKSVMSYSIAVKPLHVHVHVFCDFILTSFHGQHAMVSKSLDFCTPKLIQKKPILR